MPRQDIIYFRPEVPAIQTETVGQQARDERRGLDIAWARVDENGDGTRGSVQIGMTLSPEGFRRLGEPYKGGGYPLTRTIYAEPLTREQLNLMIRSLRRARDAAYGADE